MQLSNPDPADNQWPNSSIDELGNGEFIEDKPDDLHFQKGRNLFQLSALVIFAVVGAVVGFFQTDDRPDLAAVVGGFLGMIAGTFVSGFVLMFVPMPPTIVRLTDIKTKYQRVQRWRVIVICALTICVLLLPMFVWRFGDLNRPFALIAWFLWINVTFWLYGTAVSLFQWVQKWRCPTCGEPFCRGCGR